MTKVTVTMEADNLVRVRGNHGGYMDGECLVCDASGWLPLKHKASCPVGKALKSKADDKPKQPTMRLSSGLGMLDITHGRRGLYKRFFGKPEAEPVEVIVHGKIVNIWGNDDGISQEFELNVDKVEVVGS